jgi:CheY-like chemotaxis protein
VDLARPRRGESTIEELTRVVDIPNEDWRRAPPGRAERLAAARVTRDGAAAQSGTRCRAGSAETHFDLLEEHVTPPRKSGAHGQPASKVLLVDDEDSLRKVMRDLLERDGYAVTEARDGVQALDQVDRVGPDIIVLDLNLPGLDGYGVLSHLRSRPATAGIPVIVLTAKGDEDNEVRVFELGADDFLSPSRSAPARMSARSRPFWVAAADCRPRRVCRHVCDTGTDDRLEILVRAAPRRRTLSGVVGDRPRHDRAGRDAGAGRCASCGEETGLVPEKFIISAAPKLYQHRTGELALIPVFVAFVAEGASGRPSPEHDRANG